MFVVRSIFRTASTTQLRGRCILISDLHCGHRILPRTDPATRLELGASMSAIQSSRHCSCATRTQGQGDRHSDVVSSSSVSSLKHIQHLRGSHSSSSELACAALGVVLLEARGDCDAPGERTSLCALEVPDGPACSCCGGSEELSRGDALRCGSGREGRDSIVQRKGESNR